MLQRLTEWERRRPMWQRCVAGALLVYLLFHASDQVLRPYHLPFLWTLPLSMIGALLVGMHLRSWAWVKTWLVVGAVVAAFGVMVVLITTLSDSGYTPGMHAIVQAIGVTLITVGTVIGITYGAPAAAGVWWGKRREATKAGSTESSLRGEASTEAML